MAGFRIGRGRNSRNAQQQGPYPPQGQHHGQAPGAYGQGAYGQGAYGQGQHHGPAAGGRGGQSWHAGGGGQEEPEYFGEPQGGGYGYPGGAPHGGGHRPDSRAHSDNPGHTRAFSIHDPSPYGHDDGHGYDTGYSDGSVHSAGHAPPAGPRLHWKELLQGIVLRPNATFYRMRDYPVWGPALTVTFVYGLLAVFGLDETRESAIDATFVTALQYVVGTGVAMVIMGLMLGAVTHTLARQFGGNGMWAPTIGLSMLIMSLSDAPRLVLAMFMGGTATAVQVVGWITWIAAGALFTSMVSRSHDLPWPRALGASAIQLIALLALIKLGTL